MKNILLTALALLIITSCKSDQEQAAEEIENITYMQDGMVGLCFAITIEWGEYDSGRGLAEVPCEKVKHMIKNYVEPKSQSPTTPPPAAESITR